MVVEVEDSEINALRTVPMLSAVMMAVEGIADIAKEPSNVKAAFVLRRARSDCPSLEPSMAWNIGLLQTAQ